MKTIIVLEFIGPDGHTGWTEANNFAEAVRMAKAYKADGYKLRHYMELSGPEK